MTESIRDVAARVSGPSGLRASGQLGADIDRLAAWVLAVTEPGGDVVSVEKATERAREHYMENNRTDEAICRSVCTLHARLAERDAEIARMNDRLRETCRILVDAVGADGPCDAEDAARKAAAEIAALKAEVARLRDLVERAVRTGVARGWKMDKPAWAGVTRTFSCGSTRAAVLCREFGFDPDASTRLSDDAEPAAHDLSDADLDLLP